MKVLVATASKHGSTKEIADRISERLVGKEITVETRSVVEAGDPTSYDAVVLGSGIYAGNWIKTAKSYVDSHTDSLRRMRVWVFSSGPLGDPLKPDPAQAVTQIAPILEPIGPIEHLVFPGSIEKSNLSMGERAIIKMVKAPYGDFRDWDAIDQWADQIAAAMTD